MAGEASAVVVFRDVDTTKAHFSGFGEHVYGEVFFRIPLQRIGRDTVGREIAHNL